MLCLSVALEAEARPLRERFRLAAVAGAHGFRLYRNDTTALIVSGIGPISAAAAVGYLQATLAPPGPHGWLNLGCGGHRRLAPGSALLAHSIRAGGGRCWYPPLVFEPPCPTAALISVERPETDYPEDAVYEMEAAGFYPSACRFASAELVQVLKIVSDNAATPASTLTPAAIERLLAGQLELIATLCARLQALAAELARLAQPPAGLAAARERWRLSVSQTRQLRELLRRYQLLCPEAPVPVADFASAAELRTWLHARLAGQTLPLAP